MIPIRKPKRLLRKTVAITTSLFGFLFFTVTIGLTQQSIPGYISPPGTEYPHPPPGARPPVIYDPYQGGFVNPEAHEIKSENFKVETSPIDDDLEEKEEKAELNHTQPQAQVPEAPRAFDNPEAHELQRFMPPINQRP